MKNEVTWACNRLISHQNLDLHLKFVGDKHDMQELREFDDIPEAQMHAIEFKWAASRPHNSRDVICSIATEFCIIPFLLQKGGGIQTETLSHPFIQQSSLW